MPTKIFLKKTAVITAVFLAIIIPVITNAQLFNAPGGLINDYKNFFYRDIYSIEVSKLSNNLDSTFGLVKVCVNISHSRVSDLKLTLIAPDGTEIWLTNRNGGDSGADYYNTCFRQNAFHGYIHEAKAPFTGEYVPDSRMEFINNGQNPNGFWYLAVEDLRQGESGILNSFSLQFDSITSASSISYNKNNQHFYNCALKTTDSCLLLPDLVILPRFTQTQIKEYAWNDPHYPGQLRLAASIANIGNGPMEISGYNEWYCGKNKVNKEDTCFNGSFPRQYVYQRIYQKKNTVITWQDTLTGTLYFDNNPGHNHYHVDDWVEFRVVKKYKKKKKKVVAVAKGNKVSYCLFDTGICNSNDSLCYVNGKLYSANNLVNYGFGNYADCKSGKQGISVGGYDTYGMLYEGQFVRLPRGLKKGYYYLEIEIDPENKYIELNKENNIYSQKIYIKRQ